MGALSCNVIQIGAEEAIRLVFYSATSMSVIEVPSDPTTVAPENVAKDGSSCAPSVLIYFINMILAKETDAPIGCNVYMYNNQRFIQTILVLGALVCIPVMLFGKPCYIMITRKRKPKAANLKNKTNGDVNQGMELDEISDNNVQGSGTSHHANHEEEEAMGEIMIHQAIHTIEYTLSTISHTASYLRLWALSLAHAQLSEVLWVQVLSKLALKNGSGYIGVAFIFIAFSVWAAFTIAILVLMEGLSAFLHTLRLHWVEFMSKFYSGLGYAFEPFSFKFILEEEDEEN